MTIQPVRTHRSRRLDRACRFGRARRFGTGFLFLWALGATDTNATMVSPVGDASDPQVIAAVEALFEAMRARDGACALTAFLPDARIVAVEVGPNGTPRVQAQSAQAFAAAVGQGGEPSDEPIFQPEVQVDGGLAHVWTFYRFYVGGRFSHCGTNSIQLTRTLDGWKIAAITYSSRSTSCEPPVS